MKMEQMKVSDLIPYENNPRDNDGAVDAVANSIKEFGFLVPIVIDKENVIAAGHTRLKAAEMLGMKTVPVIRANDLSEEQIRAFRLADNKTGELAGWNFDLLPEELKGIQEIDMSAFGFDDGSEEEEKYKDQEQKIEEKETPRSRLIIAGLSLFGATDEEYIIREIDEETAAAIIDKIKEFGAETVGDELAAIIGGGVSS